METWKQTRSHFSKLGMMYLLGSLIIMAGQYLTMFLLECFRPDIMDNYTAYFLLLMLPMYAVTMPLMALLINTVPQESAPEKKKMSIGQWIITFIICYAAMYIANMIGNLITTLIGVLKGSAVSNDLFAIVTSNDIWVNILVMVLLAPIAEELLFRKLLIDRTIKYGEGISVLLSACFFGLFHGNLNQFAYAFVIGGVFAFVYAKTRNIKYTIFMHMLINFMGSFVSLGILRLSGLAELLDYTDISQEEMMEIAMSHIPGLLLFAMYILLMFGLVIAGMVLFIVNLKKIHLTKTEYSLPKGKRFIAYFANVGVLAFAVFWIILIILQLFE